MSGSQHPAGGQPAGLSAAFLPGALAAPSVQGALNAWRQGDLVQGIGMFWAGTMHPDPLTGLEAAPSPGQPWPVVPWDGIPAASAGAAGDVPEAADWSSSWSIITSQTCDVVGAGPGGRHPIVQVSPLVDLTAADPNKVTAVRRHMNVDLTPVSSVPGGGIWAADLRISLPVSKAVLLEQQRTHGFATATEAHEFAERVAGKFRRAALHDELSVALVAGLERVVKQAKKAGTAWLE